MTSIVDMVALATLGLFYTGHSPVDPVAANKFDESIIDAADGLLATFGETITYHPVGKIGDTIVGSGDILSMATLGIWRILSPAEAMAREITAIVGREGPGELPGTPHGSSYRAVVRVANNSTTGISSAEIDCGGDKVTLAVRIGKTAIERRITDIISQNAGMLTLGVR